MTKIYIYIYILVANVVEHFAVSILVKQAGHGEIFELCLRLNPVELRNHKLIVETRIEQNYSIGSLISYHRKGR